MLTEIVNITARGMFLLGILAMPAIFPAAIGELCADLDNNKGYVEKWLLGVGIILKAAMWLALILLISLGLGLMIQVLAK